MSERHLKVIVIGGGPAGLTATHALHLAGIDFVVLERRTEIVEDLGASLVLAPPSLRIMHQFGILDDLLDVGQEVLHNRSHDREGKVFNDSTAILTMRKNHGIGPVAFHRAELVEILYKGLPEAAKSKVHLGKKLSSIQSTNKGVLVACEDGTSYHGSLVLGADGVHSKTRHLMRQLALKADGALSWDPESPFVSTYSCLWCSFPRPSEPGQSFDTQHRDKSVMYISGNTRAWIFLYRKLPQQTRQRTSYTNRDIEACIEEFSDFPIFGTSTVKDVWAQRLTAGMSNLEEGIANNWTWDRIVLAGDAAHKFTPNTGQGFNTGVQDIVRLCNDLRSFQTMLAVTPTPASQQAPLLAGIFASYEKERKAAIKSEASRAAFTTRAQAWANPLYYFLGRYIFSFQLLQYILLEHMAKPEISSSPILSYVKADEPFEGVAPWKHALNGPKELA